MTLCIGALADGSTESPKIVISVDMLLGNDHHTTESFDKADLKLTDGLTALYAGPWEDMANLKRVLNRHAKSVPLTLDNYMGILIAAWKEFHAIPRASEANESATEPADSEAQCIIAGFIQGEPRIVRMDRTGIDSFPFFTAIGIGANHAEAILSWRNIQQYSSLEQVIYFVYEARCFGEMCRFVGGTRLIYIVSLNQAHKLDVDIVMAEGLNAMQGWFGKYGPRPVGYDLEFTPESIHRLRPEDY